MEIKITEYVICQLEVVYIIEILLHRYNVQQMAFYSLLSITNYENI